MISSPISLDSLESPKAYVAEKWVGPSTEQIPMELRFIKVNDNLYLSDGQKIHSGQRTLIELGREAMFQTLDGCEVAECSLTWQRQKWGVSMVTFEVSE